MSYLSNKARAIEYLRTFSFRNPKISSNEKTRLLALIRLNYGLSLVASEQMVKDLETIGQIVIEEPTPQKEPEKKERTDASDRLVEDILSSKPKGG